MSKQTVVTLPFVLLLLDWWPRRRIVDGATFRESLIEKVPLFAMTAIASVVIFLVQRGTPMSAFSAIPVIIRLENAALSYARYLGRTLWPSSLAIFYPYEQSIPAGLAAGAAILILAITITAWVLRSKVPYLLLGWLWYLGTLVPMIGIVQVGQQSHADRYTYLPLIGIFIAAAWAVYEFAAGKPSRLRAITAVAAAVLVALSVVTWRQLGHWRNGETLFAHAIEVTGDNAVAECDLGMALNLQRRSGEAIPHFERAVRIDPKYVDAWVNLGNALARNGRVDEASVAWRSALRYNPALPDVRNNLGVAYMRSGNLPQAVEQFKRAVETDPRFVPALLNLGRVSMQSGDSTAARGYFARVREIDPGNEEAASALAK
jgi:Flp pilus assembly protein TadD